MDEENKAPEVVIREFKPTLHHEMLNANKSDNPILAMIAGLPEFQEQLAEQTELMEIVNLRRRLSVADELVDGVVENIMETASLLSTLFVTHLQLSKATGMRTVHINTPNGHLQIIYTPPLGKGKK